MASLVEETLEAVNVACVRATEGIEGIGRAWQQLESKLSTLRGRKFFGAYHYPQGPYRARVAVRPGDNPVKVGL